MGEVVPIRKQLRACLNCEAQSLVGPEEWMCLLCGGVLALTGKTIREDWE